jgi:hypothetical protein
LTTSTCSLCMDPIRQEKHPCDEQPDEDCRSRPMCCASTHSPSPPRIADRNPANSKWPRADGTQP